MDLLEIFSFLGTISIFIAAILISSEKAIKPKVRVWAFSFYMCACLFLGTWGALLDSPDGNWMVVQQVFLSFINLRGLYHARKQLKLLNAVKELKFGEKNRR